MYQGKKTGAQNIVKEIKTVPEKVATTRTEDGHKQNTKALRCRPKGRRNIGRPKKRWRDQLHFED